MHVVVAGACVTIGGSVTTSSSVPGCGGAVGGSVGGCGGAVVVCGVVGESGSGQSTAAASGTRERPSGTVGSARHERSLMSVPQAT